MEQKCPWYFGWCSPGNMWEASRVSLVYWEWSYTHYWLIHNLGWSWIQLTSFAIQIKPASPCKDILTLLREVLTKRDPAINIFVEIQAAGWGGKAETVTKMLDIGATMKPTKITAYGHTQTMNGVMALEATVMTGMTGTAEAYATIGVTANGHSHRMNGMTALQLRAGRTEAQLRTLGITKKVAGHIPRPIGMDGLMEHRAKTMKRTGLLGFPHTQCRLGLRMAATSPMEWIYGKDGLDDQAKGHCMLGRLANCSEKKSRWNCVVLSLPYLQSDCLVIESWISLVRPPVCRVGHWRPNRDSGEPVPANSGRANESFWWNRNVLGILDDAHQETCEKPQESLWFTENDHIRITDWFIIWGDHGSSWPLLLFKSSLPVLARICWLCWGKFWPRETPAINIFVEIQAAGWGGKAETVTKMLDIGATMKPTKITAYGHTQTMNGVMALEATVMTGMTGTAEAYATIGVTANGHSHRMNGMTALQLRAGRTEAQLRTLGITKKVAGHIPRPIGMDGLMEHRAKTMKRTGLLGFPHTQCRLGLLRSKVQRWDPADTEAEKHFWDQTYLRQFTGTHLLESIAFIAKESATQTVSQNMV